VPAAVKAACPSGLLRPSVLPALQPACNRHLGLLQLPQPQLTATACLQVGRESDVLALKDRQHWLQQTNSYPVQCPPPSQPALPTEAVRSLAWSSMHAAPSPAPDLAGIPDLQ
jgi:hypothetical protein